MILTLGLGGGRSASEGERGGAKIWHGVLLFACELVIRNN
jgi:hypothetical protein